MSNALDGTAITTCNHPSVNDACDPSARVYSRANSDNMVAMMKLPSDAAHARRATRLRPSKEKAVILPYITFTRGRPNNE